MGGHRHRAEDAAQAPRGPGVSVRAGIDATAEADRPRAEVTTGEDGVRRVTLAGRWTLAAITPRIGELRARLTAIGGDAEWDCRSVEVLDSAGMIILWRAWGQRLPRVLEAGAEHRRAFERIAATGIGGKSAMAGRRSPGWLREAGTMALDLGDHLTDFLVLIGRVALDMLHVARHPGDMPWREVSANIYKSGVRAMPVIALVGAMVGIVLAYLSALQLQRLGADLYIVDLLGFGIIRELGPVLAALLVAGRSGSAMTAQLGVMRVTEEIDALATMGVSGSLRLVMPKVVALAVAMPLLVLWVDVLALAGGMLAAAAQIDVGYHVFLDRLPKAVPVANLWIGLAKGVVFGILVALVACHFGLRARPNTESLAANTTASVVTAITVVILVDAVFAVATRGIGVS